MQKSLFLKLSTELLDKSVELAISAESQEGKLKTSISKLAIEVFNVSGDILNEVFGGKTYSHPNLSDLKDLYVKRKIKVGNFATISREISNLLFNEKNGIFFVGKIHLDLSGSVEISDKNLKKLKSFEKKIASIIK